MKCHCGGELEAIWMDKKMNIIRLYCLRCKDLAAVKFAPMFVDYSADESREDGEVKSERN